MAQQILNICAKPDAELSILIVDNTGIQQINREFLQRDHPTNVISFAMQEGPGAGVQPQLLGDVVISVDRAAGDAAAAQIPFEHELWFLLVHGVLHLLGYDHERGSAEQAQEMEQREREVFAQLVEDFPLAIDQ